MHNTLVPHTLASTITNKEAYKPYSVTQAKIEKKNTVKWSKWIKQNMQLEKIITG